MPQSQKLRMGAVAAAVLGALALVLPAPRSSSCLGGLKIEGRDGQVEHWR